MMTASPRPSSAQRETARVAIARAPARLDLAGGWTDVPPYSDEVGGCVCNVAIDRYATVRVGDVHDARMPVATKGRLEQMPPLAVAALRRASAGDGSLARASVDVWSDFPVSAGLGGSSAAGVALAAALDAWRHCGDPALDDARRGELAEWSRAVEVEDAGIAGGRQDHYAAAFGGALRIEFGAAAGGAPARATRLDVRDDALRALARRCVVVYTGESRISGETITAVLDAYRAGERRVVRALARMQALARDIADALVASRLDDIGLLLGEHWVHQRALHPSIPTPRIDRVIEVGANAGALGAKALGASGGGCVLLLAADGRETEVARAVAALGEIVPFSVDRDGVKVVT